MNTTFAQAVNMPRVTTTTNGMDAFTNTGSKLLDVFYNIGSARNNPDIGTTFMSSYAEDPLLTLKCLFWARDVRGGAGERQVFRNTMQILERVSPNAVLKNIHLVPVYGRFDDLFVFQTPQVRNAALGVFAEALKDGNALAGKWADRKGANANDLRKYMKLTPKAYRQLIVGLSNTVEQKLCAKQFDQINYNQIPSVAAARYQATFNRRDADRYAQYKEALVTGEAKINASVVFPHDVTRALTKGGDAAVASAQWDALPNYVGNRRILPVSDVSGSMTCKASGSVTCLDVSIALGLYCASKNTGVFKDVIATFSTSPQLMTVTGTLAEKYAQLENADWGGSTDLEKTFKLILDVAVKNNVPQTEMPEIVMVLSDMQFNQATSDYRSDGTYNSSAVEMIKAKYAAAGYTMPGLVFWNLNGAYDNVPDESVSKGTVMVSGFSPTILKAVLAADFDRITPETMMMDVLNSDRYSAVEV